jgi:Lrp/AsnC family transcriptional regulator, leucine-responsive regulatory protein
MAYDSEGAYELDDLDRKIIAVLKADGRATNQQIASSLEIAAATVSMRIRRLEDLNALRVVAVTDFGALGYKVLLAIGVEVKGRSAEDVGKELAKLSEVFAVHLVTGAVDIEILVALREFEELQEFLLRGVAKIRGISSLTPAIAVDIIKYNFDQAYLT